MSAADPTALGMQAVYALGVGLLLVAGTIGLAGAGPTRWRAGRRFDRAAPALRPGRVLAAR